METTNFFGQRITDYVKKMVSSNVFLAFALNTFFLLLVLVFCDIKYEVSDDFVMASILSGAYGTAPNPQMIFVNVIIGYLLLPLYYLFPMVSWYFIAEISLVFLSSVIITFLLFEKLEKNKAWMLSIIFILFFTNDAYILIQFTKTAMFAVMAGGLLFIWALFHEKHVITIVFGALICLIGTMVRFQTIYIAGGYFLLILFYEFYLFIQKKTVVRKKKQQHLITIILSGSILIGLAFGCKWLNWYTYNNDEEYGFFYAYNNARSNVVDTASYGYDAYAEGLSEIGVSEIDYYMIREWNFADNEVFSIEKLQQVADVVNKYHEKNVWNLDTFLKRMQIREYAKYPVCIACMIVFLLGIFFNSRKWWTMLGSISVGIGLLTYFCYIERSLYRVEYSVFLGIFTCGIYFWDFEPQEKNSSSNVPFVTRICSIITVLCLMCNVFIYIPDKTYENVTSETRLAYIDETFYASGDYNAQKYRKVVNKKKPTNRLLEEIQNNSKNYYFLDFMTTIQTLYFEWSPWQNIPVGTYENWSYLGGVTLNFPEVVQHLKKNGVQNPIRSFVKENVYVVDNHSPELKLEYLKEHYYPDAWLELYKEIDGYKIWKFHEY